LVDAGPGAAAAPIATAQPVARPVATIDGTGALEVRAGCQRNIREGEISCATLCSGTRRVEAVDEPVAIVIAPVHAILLAGIATTRRVITINEPVTVIVLQVGARELACISSDTRRVSAVNESIAGVVTTVVADLDDALRAGAVTACTHSSEITARRTCAVDVCTVDQPITIIVEGVGAEFHYWLTAGI
jgi:hypothetical protein